MSFSIMLAVGFYKHGLHFFSLFVPHGTPLPMIPVIFPIELISFMVRPFSLGLRLFVAMTAGHVLLKVLAGFVINASNAGVGYGLGSEEHTSERQSLMPLSYAVFCLTKKK